MRVYLPASLALLRSWVAAGVAGPAPLTGYAVTRGLEGFYAGADTEELKYAATTRAARASLRLVGSSPRRVVLVVDVADREIEVRDDLDEGVVQLTSAVAAAHFACALVDGADAEQAVALAAAQIDAADLGDDDAEFAVDAVEDYDLEWFATQELPSVAGEIT